MTSRPRGATRRLRVALVESFFGGAHRAFAAGRARPAAPRVGWGTATFEWIGVPSIMTEMKRASSTLFP